MSTNIQSMLSLGALLIFSLISLRFDSAVLENTGVEVENKVYLTAFSLADDLLEEIKQKAFDANTTEFPTTNPTSLTNYPLGPRNGEVYPDFNDIDDFNGFSRGVDAPHAEKYLVSCEVYYVGENTPEVKSAVRTFYKRADVTVTSPYLTHPVKLSFIFTLK
jgi:hypothetical protein